MALFTYPEYTGVNWANTVGYVDIGVFGSDIPSFQPPGGSIMRLADYTTSAITALTVDWSRILAVEIDEPYVTALNDGNSDPPCNGSRQTIVANTLTKIKSAADKVHQIAPRTRVWVNFAALEVTWMRYTGCTVTLNDSTIDVVSLDKYLVDFSDIADEYGWFATQWPQQQVALVPATAYQKGGVDTPAAVATRLQGYFQYANDQNKPTSSNPAGCDMGSARVGRTGNYDGCRVWIVIGWSSEPDFPGDGGWHSLFWPGSQDSASGYPILAAWWTQFSKLRRSGQRTLTNAEIGTVLQVLQ